MSNASFSLSVLGKFFLPERNEPPAKTRRVHSDGRFKRKVTVLTAVKMRPFQKPLIPWKSVHLAWCKRKGMIRAHKSQQGFQQTEEEPLARNRARCLIYTTSESPTEDCYHKTTKNSSHATSHTDKHFASVLWMQANFGPQNS